jgi:hypothetical protein
MFNQENRPKWWQLYLVLPLLIALFVVDSYLNLSELGHQVTQIGILVFVYWLVHLWLNANATALSKMDNKQFRVTVIPIPAQRYHSEEKQPIPQLPSPEIKGVLSNTFEMDYIDIESIPVNKPMQSVKQE